MYFADLRVEDDGVVETLGQVRGERVLVRRGDVAQGFLVNRWGDELVSEEIAQSRFEARETEVAVELAMERKRKGMCIGVALLRRTFDRRSSGIGESEQRCTFIERLTGGVIACPAQEYSIDVRVAQPQFRVSSRCGEGEDWERRCLSFVGHVRWEQPHGAQVPERMVDGNEWDTPRATEDASRRHADEQ